MPQIKFTFEEWKKKLMEPSEINGEFLCGWTTCTCDLCPLEIECRLYKGSEQVNNFIRERLRINENLQQW